MVGLSIQERRSPEHPDPCHGNLDPARGPGLVDHRSRRGCAADCNVRIDPGPFAALGVAPGRGPGGAGGGSTDAGGDAGGKRPGGSAGGLGGDRCPLDRQRSGTGHRYCECFGSWFFGGLEGLQARASCPCSGSSGHGGSPSGCGPGSLDNGLAPGNQDGHRAKHRRPGRAGPARPDPGAFF